MFAVLRAAMTLSMTRFGVAIVGAWVVLGLAPVATTGAFGAQSLPTAAALAAATAMMAPQASAADGASERARLAAMCGTWDVEMTLWPRPGGRGIATTGTSTISPLFNGLFIEEKIEGTLNGAPFATLAWTGFNPTTHQYEATRIASTNAVRIAEVGRYDEKTQQFELSADYPLAGDMWHQRTVIQPTSADTMLAASYLSFGSVPEWKAVEIKYARKAK